MQFKVSPNCSQIYEAIKFRKQPLRYVIFKVGQGEEIVVQSTGDRDKTWQDFIAAFPNEPRYSAFDLQYVNKDNMKISKLAFIYWCPDGVPIKTRMTYAHGKENFKTLLGVTKQVIVDKKDHTIEALIKSVS